MSELSPTELDHFIHAGEDDRFSVIATMVIDGIDTIVGEARYAINAETAGFEFALSVDDNWQGHGVGSALLRNLECRAAAFGADRLFGDTLRSNDAMIGLARKSGFAFAANPDDWKLVRFEKHVDAAQDVPVQLKLAATFRHLAMSLPRVDKTRPGSVRTGPFSFQRLRLCEGRAEVSLSPEHRLALFDERLHRLAMIRGHGGADQPFGFVIARRGEIEQQGFVEIVFHVAQSDGRAFGDRFGQRKGFGLKLVVRHHAVDKADGFAARRVDLVGR